MITMGTLPAAASSTCSISVTTSAHAQNKVYAKSTLRCSGVKSVRYVTKMYLYWNGAYRDGTYMGNHYSTVSASYSSLTGTKTQGVSAQDDQCKYMSWTNVTYYVGSTKYSKGDSAVRNLC